MPCHDPRSDQAIRDQKIELDKVTRLLCYVSRRLYASILTLESQDENEKQIIQELHTWIDIHHEVDKVRLRSEVLNKLDLHEKAILKELLEDD